MRKYDKESLGDIFDEIQSSAGNERIDAQNEELEDSLDEFYVEDDFVTSSMQVVQDADYQPLFDENAGLAYEQKVVETSQLDVIEQQETGRIDLDQLDEKTIDTGILSQPIHFDADMQTDQLDQIIEQARQQESLEQPNIDDIVEEDWTDSFLIEDDFEDEVSEKAAESTLDGSLPQLEITKAMPVMDEDEFVLEGFNDSRPSQGGKEDGSQPTSQGEKKETTEADGDDGSNPPEKKKKEKKKKKKGLHWFTIMCLVVDLCAVCCFFTAYGPIDTFRDWLVTTAMSTATHRYLAYILYTEEMVEDITSKYVTTQTETSTDTSAIVFEEYDEETVYSSIYDEQVCVKDEDNDLYKIIEIDEDGYAGYITVIYDPTRLSLVVTENKNGQYVSSFAEENDALVAINCGPAKWYNSNTLLKPYNTVIADGKIVYDPGEEDELIGMNSDGVLCLFTGTAEEAIEQDMVWAVSFGPYLIVNGVMTEFTGNGGYGTNPRTAIGQRQDGIVLLFTIDGRGGNGSSGITMTELADLMQRYGCYNAANLDGGGSTTLVENGEVINSPVSYNHTGERKLYNALIYK